MHKNITFRERQVLQCLAEGLTSKETAEKLFLSLDTIKTYRSRLLLKFNAKNAFQLGMKSNSISLLAKSNLHNTIANP